MNNQYKPKIDNQSNPDFKEGNQWEVQPEYLPLEQDSVFEQDFSIEEVANTKEDTLREIEDIYLKDASNKGNVEILLSRDIDCIQDQREDAQYESNFINAGEKFYADFKENNPDLYPTSKEFKEKFKEALKEANIDVVTNKDQNGSTYYKELNDPFQILSYVLESEDFSSKKSIDYIYGESYNRQSLLKKVSFKIPFLGNKLREKEDREKEEELSRLQDVRDQLHKTLNVEMLNKDFSLFKIYQVLEKYGYTHDASPEEKEVLANLVRERAEEIFFDFEDRDIDPKDASLRTKKSELMNRISSFLGEDFLQENRDLNFWRKNSVCSYRIDDKFAEVVKNYKETNNEFGKNGNIEPTEDFIRFYIYSGGGRKEDLYDFIPEDSPLRLVISENWRNLEEFEPIYEYMRRYEYSSEKQQTILLNFIEHRELFDNLNNYNHASCIIELFTENAYDRNHFKNIENITKLTNPEMIKFAVETFKQSPELYKNREGIISQLDNHRDAYILSYIARRDFDLAIKVSELLNDNNPSSMINRLISRVCYDSNIDSINFIVNNADLIDNLNPLLSPLITKEIRNGTLKENFDKIMSINDEIGHLDKKMIEILLEIYRNTNKLETDKAVEIFEATNGMYSDIVGYDSMVSRNIIHALLDMDSGYIDALKKIDKIYSSSEVPEFIKRFYFRMLKRNI